MIRKITKEIMIKGSEQWKIILAIGNDFSHTCISYERVKGCSYSNRTKTSKPQILPSFPLDCFTKCDDVNNVECASLT